MLALELDLGPAFHFHSKFSCAVSREQTSCNNPPVLLSCGHTICRWDSQDFTFFVQFGCMKSRPSVVSTRVG